MKPLEISLQLTREFPPNRRHLVGVSGGRDSVALLHWLTDLGYKKLIVCHLNHRLRGRSSDADARFVQKLAEKYRLEFEIRVADVRADANKKKTSIETAAREARYLFFAAAAKRHHCRTIFLAHHADDQVETFLINLFRGAGSAGLAAMQAVSMRRIAKVVLRIVRPFLTMWRTDVDEYLREHRLRFREDASNKSLVPLRNRLRQRAIPYLEKLLGRNVRQSIWRTALIVAEEQSWIDNQLVPDRSGPQLSVAHLRALPIALQRRAILKWLRAQNIADIGLDVVERVRSLADRESCIAKTNLPRDRHARRRAGKIFIE